MHHYQLNSTDYNIQIIQNQVILYKISLRSVLQFFYSLVSGMWIIAIYMITKHMIPGDSTGRGHVLGHHISNII